jgi:hypothetical protein
MRVWCLLALVACKGKDDASVTPSPSGSAPAQIDAGVVTDWAACGDALKTAMKVPPTRRVQAILDGCKVCDFKPLIDWDKLQTEGGPTRLDIEGAMLSCSGYCDNAAKQRFLGTLDNARGHGGRGPWRYLGEMCKDKVSAVPDTRYMSAPYFVLDRIARAASARQDLVPVLATIDLVMPAIAVTGASYELPKSPATTPDPGPLALTVTQTEMRIAAVPHAKLTADGVVIQPGEPYPGDAVKTDKELDAAIDKILPKPAGGSAPPPDPALAVFAPRELPAMRVLDALGVTKRRDVHLAVAAAGAPPGWAVAGTIPVTLVLIPPKGATRFALTDDAAATALIKDAKDKGKGLLATGVAIDLGKAATVGALAKVLGALAYFDVKTVALASGK